MTLAAHEGKAHRVVATRRIRRNEKDFFIVPYRGGHKRRDRKYDFRLVDSLFRKEGLETKRNIVGAIFRVNLEAEAIFWRCPVLV